MSPQLDCSPKRNLELRPLNKSTERDSLVLDRQLILLLFDCAWGRDGTCCQKKEIIREN